MREKNKKTKKKPHVYAVFLYLFKPDFKNELCTGVDEFDLIRKCIDLIESVMTNSIQLNYRVSCRQ